ncbi:hypothetical protein IFM89_038902 [Coptis chinensis]|uniref:Uncharacterized protein n=1 Tax=Coptis chinensis TaxID=261450 RepID=A0A835J424_9MAGN|nr:hypothetical protein IFM89_038902 [Coptis chinensis]
MGPRKEKLTPQVNGKNKATPDVVEKSAPTPRIKTDDAWKKCFIEMCLEEAIYCYKQKYPLASHFRNAPLANSKLLEFLFEPTVSYGDEGFNHKHPIPMVTPHNVHTIEVENIDSASEDNQIHGADYLDDHFSNVTYYEEYNPYISQDDHPSHVPSDNVPTSCAHSGTTPAPPKQTQVPTTSRAKSDAGSSKQKRKSDSPEPDLLVKSIGWRACRDGEDSNHGR